MAAAATNTETGVALKDTGLRVGTQPMAGMPTHLLG